jgi:hypothetical protein
MASFTRWKARRHASLPLPLFAWAEATAESQPASAAARWLVQHHGVLPALAETIARAAGLGGGE